MEQDTAQTRGKASTRLAAPEVLDIIENTDATLNFFGTVLGLIDKRKPVFLDLSGLRHISTDSIMCLVATIEAAGLDGRRCVVQGNYPDSPSCNQILIDSGFYGLVYSDAGGRRNNHSETVCALRSGKTVNPVEASALRKFLVDRLGIPSNSRRAKRAYEAIIECMANTQNHAYGEQAMGRKWWLMAYHSAKGGAVHFTFMDTGLGIPVTVRRKALGDSMRRLVKSKAEADADLLASAMRGEQRTSTGRINRGKGLKMIYDCAQNGCFSRLHVLSRQGMVDCRADVQRGLRGPLRGTVLCWAIESGSIDAAE